MEILTAFLTYANVAIFFATGALLYSVRKLPRIDQHPLWAWVQPIAPLLVATALVFLPGASDAQRWGEKVVVGIAIGGLAAVGYKWVVQSWMRQDKRFVQSKPEPPETTATP